MTPAKLARLVRQSVQRNRRDFALSSVGIVVGIATLLFFTALGAGIKTVVLEQIFEVGQLEVVKPSYDVGAFKTEGGLFGGKELDERTVARLREIDGVAEVYPKMKLTFPSSVRGGEQLLGKNVLAELIADGIPPELVSGELAGEYAFRDWEAPVACEAAGDCPGGHTCSGGACEPLRCGPAKAGGGGPAAAGQVCTGHSYCDRDAGRCAMPIPVIISPKLLELYNANLQTAMGGATGMLAKMPKLSQDALVGFELDATFGASYLGRAQQGDAVDRRLRLVGFSDKAIDIGATMPIGYVQRLNARFRGEEAAGEYHSIVVETATNEAVPRVVQAVTDEMGLALSEDYENAQRAGLVIMLLTIVFNLISLIILTISAVNIMHTFLMVILERRREIGLMQALGATRREIRLLVLGEATLLGLVGGLVGLGLGWGVVLAVDWLFATQVPDFPFKPDSLFAVEPWMLAACLGVAVVFCWIGALLPAIQASRIDPAQALTGR